LFGEVDKFVTIGCPFDYVRAFWKDYYTDRALPGAGPARWVNVYARRDIFGSNFHDGDSLDGPATRGIGLKAPDTQGEEKKPDRNIAPDTQAVERKPDRNIRYGANRDLSAGDIVRLVGYKEHHAYWSADVHATSALEYAVAELYLDGSEALTQASLAKQP
jgi:hypothetical protein